jgi:glyoxylase-like metal-dependent hydrolase (beta-lactamase superfamily II)
VTHAHQAHVNGIKTVQKVYDTKIYSMSPTVLDFETVQIHDGQQLSLAGIHVSATHIPGHSSDSVIYRIGDWLFTGDVLYAGGIGKTRTGYARALMVSSLRERVMTMEDHLLVFPGHGPPSTLEAEKATNAAMLEEA